MLGTKISLNYVFDCGRFFSVDSCSLDKERLDYAHVFISTHSLEVINFVDKIIVDGFVVEIKIRKE